MLSTVKNGQDPERSDRSINPALLTQRACVGPYRLCVELASGGMASVYLARAQLGGSRPMMVAVKLIHSHLANDLDFIQMFVDEAELASQIQHPNVCAVLDYAGHDGEHYIAMEYLVGESLMSIWRALARCEHVDRPRLARCVARILSDACEGLHAAHQLTDANGELLQVVHRDVSPENVFVTYDGVAKVMDFGVASAARKRHRTQAGMVKGKFAYIAPECLRGAKADRRADVWGIGVIAWELLTGKRLFRRESDLDTLHAVNDGPIPRPSDVQPDLPPELDAIVMRALAREPDARYATTRELARDLARFAAGGGDVVACSDVAEWLNELLPAGKERRRRVVELAKQVEGADEGVRIAPQLERGSWSPPPLPSPPRAPQSPEPAPAQEQTLATRLWQGSSPPPALPAPAAGRARGGRLSPALARAAGLVVAGFVLGCAVAQMWPEMQRASVARAAAVAAAVEGPAYPPSVIAATASPAAPRDEIVVRIRVETAPPPASAPTPGDADALAGGDPQRLTATVDPR